ncbi:MAG: excinuclease ABC subunit A, partial [Flavobacteriaceae bacterium]|nr:excinuclease ABC subunit A [Flavobacteriaceae bacterium]
FSSLELSKVRNYKPKHFSFNVDGGRCDNCKGEGSLTIEMQFMADVIIECNQCKGSRFKNEICEVQYYGKSINDLLNMTIDDSITFFKSYNENKIAQKLKPLSDVGLGYIRLGQSSSTLSGGEAQRIKLASFLSHRNFEKKILFIFDEPTTGLHFHDINKLVNSFYHLIEKGHSIIVVEHNLDLIKIADHIIDLGPGAGDKGGQIIAEGDLNKIIKNKNSFTGKYLVKQLN